MIIRRLLFIATVAVMAFVTPSTEVFAQEAFSDYVMVDMKTGEEEVIDLDETEYSEVEEFVSQPSFSNVLADTESALTKNTC